MPTKPIDRLLFAQGGDCFFCKQKLAKTDASIEHLVAQTHGGKDNDENLVVCCKTLNNLLGRMSLKEKLEVILKQKSGFQCPATVSSKKATASAKAVNQPTSPTLKSGTPLAIVVDNLRKRGNSRPTRFDKLLNTAKTALEQQKLDVKHAEKILSLMRQYKWIEVDADKVSYHLPPAPAK